MHFTDEDICQITQNVWVSILELEIQRSTREVLPNEQGSFLTGLIQISGAWEGTVAVQYSVELAHQAATIMFTPETTTLDDIRDALGELVNMIGGSIKSLLPELCELSLPAVTSGTTQTTGDPSMQLISQIAFECNGQPLLVTLLERNPAPQGV